MPDSPSLDGHRHEPVPSATTEPAATPPEQTAVTPPDQTAVTSVGLGGVTYYGPPPATPPDPRPPVSGGGWRRHLGGIIAVVAVSLAVAISGAAFVHHIAYDAVTTTSAAQPAAPSQQAPSLGGDSATPPSSAYGDGSSSGTTSDTGAVAAKVSAAIVDITVKNSYSSSGGAATGIVLTSDGLVLTNNHVIDGATDISAVDVGNGNTYAAKVVGYDVTHDMALIQLQDASGLTTASIGDSASLAVGDMVIGVGNAGGTGGTPTVAAGTVVALDQQIVASDAADGSAEQLSGLIQTDANIQSGDSGGPLVDADGNVIGVMTAASSGNSAYGYGGGYSSGGNEGYAVPIATAMQIVDQIKSGTGTSTVHVGATAFLGVQTTSADAQGAYGYGGSDQYGNGYGDPYGYGNGSSGQSAQGSGATVAAVVAGSPADKAGLTAGDVITAVDGDAVTSASGLSDLIAVHHPGDAVTVTWTDSSGSQHSEQVTLAEGPAK